MDLDKQLPSVERTTVDKDQVIKHKRWPKGYDSWLDRCEMIRELQIIDDCCISQSSAQQFWQHRLTPIFDRKIAQHIGRLADGTLEMMPQWLIDTYAIVNREPPLPPKDIVKQVLKLFKVDLPIHARANVRVIDLIVDALPDCLC